MEKYLRINYNELEFQDLFVLDFEINKALNRLLYENLNERDIVFVRELSLDKIKSIEIYEDGICKEIIDL